MPCCRLPKEWTLQRCTEYLVERGILNKDPKSVVLRVFGERVAGTALVRDLDPDDTLTVSAK